MQEIVEMHERRGRFAPAGTQLAGDASPFTVMDLFSGAGGISEGFRQAGFDVIAGSDNDPDAAATFALNFPSAAFITGDIREPRIKERILDSAKSVDVLVGGPPCQAFSQVRNHTRLIDDPRNSLYREFIDVLNLTRPKAFLMENVTGIDQMGVLEEITNDLRLDGLYTVLPQILDAADFGVPQTRLRLIFIGILSSLPAGPPLLTGSSATSAAALVRTVEKTAISYRISLSKNPIGTRIGKALSDPSDAHIVSVSDAISDLESLRVGNRKDELPYASLPRPRTAYQRLMRAGAGEFLTNAQVPRIKEDTILRLNSIPQGGNYRDLADALQVRYITGERWGQDNGTGRLSRKHFYAYRKLHPGIWAWTLNTKADSAYHYGTPRALSVREFARLQSFPDRFQFVTDPRKGQLPGRHDGGAAHSRYRQVGNAVPPLLARAVAENLSAILAGLVQPDTALRRMG